MKKQILIGAIVILIILIGVYTKKRYYDPLHRFQIAVNEVKELDPKNEIRSGDLIFQTSLSAQSEAIENATHSIYSHCGLIYREDDDYFVFEAVQPVRRTLLAKWIASGKDGKFVIKRLKNADQVLTPEILSKMRTITDSFIGKNYDITFEWSDDKIYCSEFIWKIYQKAIGIEIGKLQKLKEFDLTGEAVKRSLKDRYGANIPYDETIISPGAIFDSELLTTVKAN